MVGDPVPTVFNNLLGKREGLKVVVRQLKMLEKSIREQRQDAEAELRRISLAEAVP